MSGEYFYNGMDITLDVYEKLRETVELLAAEDGVSFDEELVAFALSATYAALADTRTLMWSEPPGYIAEDYRRERASRGDDAE